MKIRILNFSSIFLGAVLDDEKVLRFLEYFPSDTNSMMIRCLYFLSIFPGGVLDEFEEP